MVRMKKYKYQNDTSCFDMRQLYRFETHVFNGQFLERLAIISFQEFGIVGTELATILGSMKKQIYKIMKHPKNHLWYVTGNCGDGWWMKVSDGYKTYQEAKTQNIRYIQADRAALAELKQWAG